jgi:hypothetical protein
MSTNIDAERDTSVTFALERDTSVTLAAKN